MNDQLVHSGLYVGHVYHARYTPIRHDFSYQLYMLGLCLDELDGALQQSHWFGTAYYNALRFNQMDYLQTTNEMINQQPLKQRLKWQVQALGGDWGDDLAGLRATMLVQCRCLGIYFSPVNFYFCYDHADRCQYMLAEVSNTPWGERHFYLVDAVTPQDCDKDFHVSPFMNMDMVYRWQIKPPADDLLVKIENHAEQKLFSAVLTLKKRELNPQSLRKLLVAQPVMTSKIFAAIYWQAIKLLIKKVPFVSHPNIDKNSST